MRFIKFGFFCFMFIFLISSVLGAVRTNTNNYPSLSGSDNHEFGMVIKPIVDMQILNISFKETADLPSGCNLRNGTAFNSAIIGAGTFSGLDCIFTTASNRSLAANQSYGISWTGTYSAYFNNSGWLENTDVDLTFTTTSWRGDGDVIGTNNPRAFPKVGIGTTAGEVAGSVTLNAPSSGFITSATNITFNWTLAPSQAINTTIVNSTLYIWFSNGTIFNQTFLSQYNVNVSNTTLLSVFNFTPNNYKWNALGCFRNSTSRFCDFAPSNLTFTRQGFSVENEHWNRGQFETEQSYFQINITVSEGELFSASFNYSNRLYPAEIFSIDSDSYRISKTIDIPNVSAQINNNFNWIINFRQAGTFTTTATANNTQQVNDTDIYTETANNATINFTIRDEDTLQLINANFKNQFVWWLGNGSENESKGFNRGIGSNFMFGINPSSRNFTSNIFIDLTNSTFPTNQNNTYSERIFEFSGDIYEQGKANSRNLFLLSAGNGTDFKIQVRDTGLTPLENYLVQIYRFYPSENKYRLVESRKTDSFGQISARVIQNNIKYRIEFYDNENVLAKTESNVFFVCTALFCTAQFIIEDTEDIFERFGNLTNYEYTLTFNNNTNIFDFVWNDNRETTGTHRLEVKRHLFNGTTTICNPTSTAVVGVLSCNVGSERASYTAQAFRKVGNTERRIDVLSVSVGKKTTTFGFEGLMWTLLLSVFMISVGVFYPPLGIILYLAMTFFLGILDVIYISPIIIVAQLVIGVLFIWSFRG